MLKITYEFFFGRSLDSNNMFTVRIKDFWYWIV